MSKKRKYNSTTPEGTQGVQSTYSHPTLSLLAPLGLLLVMVGTVMPLLGSTAIFRWVYAVGAVTVLLCRLFSPYRGENLRIKRLMRIELWSGLFFCVATFFMFYPGAAMRDWIAFTMAGAVIQIYTSIMIPRENKKEK